MPRATLTRLNAEINKALHTSDVSGRLTGIGIKVVGDTPEEFAAKNKSDIVLIGRIVKTAGINTE